MALLDVHSITKVFEDKAVLQDVSFSVGEGEIVCLLGPSGCGKTTLLRIIAGLEMASSGYLVFDGVPLDQVPVHRRGFGLMFQDFALFPHKDVLDNVTFGLRMQGLPQSQVEARAADMLAVVGLQGYERRQVYDLSGGEQQRVALARSLAPGPRLLMLDEPLGSLDRTLREDLMNELRAILKRVGVTAIYVTHDQQEAFAIADRLLIMNQGCIVQRGTPEAVYRYPASGWVARFLGLTNLVPGEVTAVDPLRVATPLGELRPAGGGRVNPGDRVTVLIRPEAAHLAADCPDGDAILVEAPVRECSFRGGHCRLVIEPVADAVLVFELVSEAAGLPVPGGRVTLCLRQESISLLVEGEDEEQAASRSRPG
jgi:ABC-type Fe3+/spermidine/putrescine transport system ATPase subunit